MCGPGIQVCAEILWSDRYDRKCDPDMHPWSENLWSDCYDRRCDPDMHPWSEILWSECSDCKCGPGVPAPGLKRGTMMIGRFEKLYSGMCTFIVDVKF